MKRTLILLSISFFSFAALAQNEQQTDSLRKVLKQPAAEDSMRARAMIMLSHALVHTAPDSSQLLADEALQLSKKIEWQMGVALALRQKGNTYYYTSDFIKAIEYCQEALKAGASLRNKLFDASVYNNLGNIYADMGNQEEALSYYNKLLIVAGDAPEGKKYEPVALTNIGSIYSEREDYTKAFDYFNKALLASRQLNNMNDVCAILANIGITLKNAGDHKAALSYLHQGLAAADSAGSKFIRAMILNSLAGLHTDNKEYSKARMFAEEALALGKEINNASRQSDAYSALSDIYAKEGDNAKALEAYKQHIVFRDSVLNDEKKQEITKKSLQFEFAAKQAIANSEINKQKIIRNISIGTGSVLILAAIATFIFYKRRKDAETRKHEAELKAEIADTEMKALRAQMNPHFIFNSLNSIADYIDKNQTEAASGFTAKFAKLMRMVLENSEHREIPLANDLKALELYIQLERFRLNNKFDYTIRVDENIDKENVLVPPLILQPFVENSIWHGVAKQEGHGVITIYIRLQNGMINCTVEDNGPGISQTAIAGKENKSLGIRIARERIAVINKLKNSNARINVFGKDKGVVAEVSLPLELSF